MQIRSWLRGIAMVAGFCAAAAGAQTPGQANRVHARVASSDPSEPPVK